MNVDASHDISPREQSEPVQSSLGSTSDHSNLVTPLVDSVHKVEDPTTAKFAPPEIGAITPRWGAVVDSTSRQLAFSFSDQTEPVIITCSGELVIGRSSHTGAPPDLDLTQYEALANGVSRHHAKIWYDSDMLKLVDLGSTNGTFLNGLRLPAHQPRILRDGDEVTFGRLSVRIRVM